MAVTPIWPEAAAIDEGGELTFHGRSASSLLDEFGSPLYVLDTDEIAARASRFRASATAAFSNTTTHVSFAAKAFLSKEVARLVVSAGLFVDTCTLGEMRIALAAGVPGRRLVLHGNNKSDEEIALAIEHDFAKIVIDAPDEVDRIVAIARRLGRRARVMLRVTTGIHAGGHEYISTAHEDQKFGVALLPQGMDPEVLAILDSIAAVTPAVANARLVPGSSAVAVAAVAASAGPETTPAAEEDSIGGPQAELGPDSTDSACRANHEHAAGSRRELRYDIRYPYDLKQDDISDGDRALANAMQAVADGPAVAVLKAIYRAQSDLELVGIHSHIGSQIHDAGAFIEAARRMMLLRKTFYATDAYTLPEVDLGGGYSVAYTDGEDSMNIEAELERLSGAVGSMNRALGMPAPVISFEPGRWIIAPAGVTLYRVGTVKYVALPAGSTARDGSPLAKRVYVSVDGGMSDNIRPALYDAEYTARLANRPGAGATITARVVGKHCESGDILVHECQLPADIHRGDILAIPVTGAYGRTMASNYNQMTIPAVAAISEQDAHVMLRRQTIDDLVALDLG